jgi:deoxyadenosine/deoxycytidine kinase
MLNVLSEAMAAPGFLVIEGPIGVGKTSLAKRLAQHFGAETLLEGAEANPFLKRFYDNPRAAALPAQLYFLFQRSQQMNELQQGDMFRQRLVADFMMEKDRLFAELNLDAEELKLYTQVSERIALQAPAPDLVVYLQAPVDVLLARVKKRARAQERAIEKAYLQRLCDAYAEFFYHYERSPMLIINAAQINPLDNEADFRLLVEHICAEGPQRRYLNPIPSLF